VDEMTERMISATPWLDAPSHKVWKAGIESGIAGDPPAGSGLLLGKQLEPWYIAAICYDAGWQEAFELLTTDQVVLAESQGYTLAIHVNADGSRDRGIFQLNDIHAAITDEIAYDPVKAAAAAFDLWASARGWEPWAAYTTDVFLHDSYLSRASRGVGNFLCRRTLELPVKDWAGKPYVHKLAGSILNYEWRLGGAVHHIEQAQKDLPFAPATKERVQMVRTDLAHALTAARKSLPD
jgi:hypothetical protein